MLGKAPTQTVVAVLLGFGVVFAMPLAGAFSMGVDAASVPAMKGAGATPAYGQTWVGAWMRSSGWAGYETDMRTMRDNGVMPVVMWYYWGDGISVNCVQYGCNGNSKGNWDAMAKDLAARGNAIMGGKPFLVVLEPEFNKNGVASWETFDGYLADQARMIKAAAPNAKIVVGFGNWGGWDIFDRAMGEATYSGFQLLYGSTRHSSGQAIAAADDMIRIAKTLKAKFGKDIIMFDLGVATYGGWEWVQEASLQRVAAKRGEIDAAGIKAIVWRYVKDNNYSSGYFGPAESTWGVKYANGGAKSGYDDLVGLIRGSPAAPAPTPVPTPAPVPTGGFTATFANVKGNTWWVQADVTANQPLAKVQARVNGGAWIDLTKQSWGANSYAKSFYVAPGAKVEVQAVSTTGATKVSGAYGWT
jgi:hypothetical protein